MSLIELNFVLTDGLATLATCMILFLRQIWTQMELLSAILIYLIVHRYRDKVRICKNMDLESQEPRFNTNLGDQTFLCV